MPLTTTEKQHWRDRIAKRIDKKIAGITALEPGLFSRIESQARTCAIESLGLAELMTEQARVEQEMQALKSREEQLTRDVLSRLRGIEPDKIDSYSVCRSDHEINTAIKARQTAHEETLLREHDLGRQITQLRLEKENLLDTVFLATSPTRIRSLWGQVSDLLCDELSQLQRAAMQIQPSGESGIDQQHRFNDSSESRPSGRLLTFFLSIQRSPRASQLMNCFLDCRSAQSRQPQWSQHRRVTASPLQGVWTPALRHTQELSAARRLKRNFPRL